MVSVIARKTLPVDNRLAESLLELRNKNSYAGLDSVFANSRGRPRSQQNVPQRYLLFPTFDRGSIHISTGVDDKGDRYRAW